MLRMCFSTNPSLHPSMWLREWQSRKRVQVIEADSDDTISDDESEGESEGFFE